MAFRKESIPLITRVMKKRGWIELPAQGTSMFPFIRNGNICRFEVAEAANIKKGDILLFHTPHGKLVAHRFCRIVARNQQLLYLCKGDSNLAYDEAITMDQLIGRMIWMERNGRSIPITGKTAYVWGRAILAFPFISMVLRYYLNRRESMQG